MQVTGAAQLKLYWSINGGLAMNVYGLRVSGAPTFDQALANTLGSAIKTTAFAQITGQLATTTSLVRVGIRDLRTDNQPEFRDTNAPVAGTGTGDPMPGKDAVCITIRTANSGKSFRGRSYIAGFTEGANTTTGTIATAAATAAINFITQISVATNASGLKLGVLSTPSEHVVISETTHHDDGTTTVRVLSDEKARGGGITDAIAFESRNSLWESQRRRDNGRGPAPTSLNPVAVHYLDQVPATPE